MRLTGVQRGLWHSGPVSHPCRMPLLALVLSLLALPACAQVDPASFGTTPGETVTQTASTPDADATAAASSAPAAGTVTCAYPPGGGSLAKPVDPPQENGVPATGTVTVTLQMTNGPVTITMDRAKAPCTVNNFESLAEQGYFTGTKCHRLVDVGIFILQCGDPSGSGRGGPGYTFADELTGKETYTSGVVAMANAGPDTNGSQFFFVWEDSDLDPDYTVFGSIDKASRDTIASMAAEGADPSSVPMNPSEITKVTVG